MRVLIVGCGYVGLKLGADLVGQGHQVWGLRRSNRADAQLQAIGILPLHADITSTTTFPKSCPQFDWVVHSVSSSGGGVDQYEQTYFNGTRNLLNLLSARPPEKLVYTSSTSVYGQSDASWVNEESPVQPSAATAQVLLRAEQLLLQAASQSSFPAVVLRVAGIYGPGRAYWLEQVASGQARSEGEGGRFINMVHRDDVAGAIAAALVRGVAGRVYNVVDDRPVTQIDLLTWVSSRLNRPLAPRIDPSQSQGKRGSTNKRVSNRRLKADLGYSLQFSSFKEGFEALLAG